MSGVSPYPTDAFAENDNRGVMVEPARPDASAPLDQHESARPTEPELTGIIADLAAAGVSVSTARRLIDSYGEGVCRLQLQALPYRKAVDRSAVLVASIRGSWAIPEQVRKCAQKAQKAAVRRSVVESEDKHRSALMERLSALPTAVREALEHRALSLWKQEQPAAARIMGDRPSAASVIRSYTLRLLEKE
jgi:hypothetical protein